MCGSVLINNGHYWKELKSCGKVYINIYTIKRNDDQFVHSRPHSKSRCDRCYRPSLLPPHPCQRPRAYDRAHHQSQPEKTGTALPAAGDLQLAEDPVHVTWGGGVR